MSDEDLELQKLLLETFAVEAQEKIEAISKALLALERETAPEASLALIEEIFREAHSLKGAARAVELGDIEEIGHHLESLFDRIKKGQVQATAETFNLAHRSVDIITALADAEPRDTKELVAALQAAAEGAEQHDVGPSQAELETVDPAAEEPTAVAEEPVEVAPEPPATTTVAEPSARPASRKREETVRVSTGKLDALAAQIGELLAARVGAEQRLVEAEGLVAHVNFLEDELRRMAAHTRTDMTTITEPLRTVAQATTELKRNLAFDVRRMGQITGDLQEEVRRVRMLPVSNVFNVFPRMIRDLAQELGKQVDFVIEGGDTEVDRTVLEQLKDPLTHMLRNSVDHGLESPAARVSAGKPAEGTLTLKASHRDAQLIIEVSDDGAGIDADRVKASAVGKGLVTTTEAEGLTDREATWLIFRSGFSTREEVSDVSGRGVGMDVVREHIERMHGIIELDTTLGAGTNFQLSMPLSVATARCLLISAGDQTFALPIPNVERILRDDEASASVDGRAALVVDGTPLPLAHICDVLGIPAGPEHDQQPVIVLGSAEKRAALRVDDIIGSQELAIKPLPAPIKRARHLAGATILGTGEVVAILNAGDLLRGAATTTSSTPASDTSASRRSTAASANSTQKRPSSKAGNAKARKVLVVDDSATIRALHKALLARAGYEVEASADGLEGFEQLEGGGFDAVVCDVEMPNLDGVGLLERVRASPKHRQIPFVLVTTLASPEDRERGLRAGADAYLVKGSSEQEQLLDLLERLV